MFTLIAAHVTVLTAATGDRTPTPDQTVAGPWGFLVFLGLLIAVALLGWSLTRQLKKAQRAADEGKYDPSDKKPRRTTI